MAALIALAAIGLFAAGVIAGIIGVASMAARREERNLTLTSEATDNLTRAGRWLNGVYVRAPRRTAAANRQTTLAQPASRGSPASTPAQPEIAQAGPGPYSARRSQQSPASAGPFRIG